MVSNFDAAEIRISNVMPDQSERRLYAEDLALSLLSFSLASFACAEKLNPDPTKRYTLNVVFTAMPQG